MTIRLLALVRDDQVDGVDEGPRLAVGMRDGLELLDHLLEVALHERLHLGPVDGDVAAGLDARPDDRVHLALGAAGVGCGTSMLPATPAGAGATTRAAAPSPKIMRDVRTLPTCLRTSRRRPGGRGAGLPAGCGRRLPGRMGNRRRPRRGRPTCGSGTCRTVRRATSRPTAGDGCLVQVQKWTAPVSSGDRPARSSALDAASRARCSSPPSV